jgi:lysophospholipase L1-like esterase
MPAQTKSLRRRRLFALALSLLFSLLLAEVCARLLRGSPMAERLPLMQMIADRVTGWRMAPNHDHYTYQHLVHVNALGLRGEELGDKVADEVRVLVLGDSNIYGQGVADADTIPASLGRTLANGVPARRWRVINAGHRAYDTRQELAQLEQLLPDVRPDVVVVGWYWNDLHERDIDATFRRLDGQGPLTFDTNSKVEGMERFLWELRQLARRSALVMLVHDMFADRNRGLTEPFVQAGMQRLDGYLARMQRLAKEQQFDLVFATVPDCNALEGNDETIAVDDQALAIAQRHGIATIDLRNAARSAIQNGRLPVLAYDGHFDPRANAAMGDAIGKLMLERRLPTHRQ